MTPSVRSSFLIIGLCFLVYANALPNGFVYDDWDLIVNNPWSREGPLLEAFRFGYWETTRGGSSYYRPVVTLSYRLGYRLWRENPFGYHLENIFLHALASLLTLSLATRWLASSEAGLAAAALFAVHPVHTQSVAWIAGRTDLLAAVLFLVALWLQQAAVDRLHGSPSGGGRGAGWAALLASLPALALALLSKEMAITYVPALCLHALLLAHRHRGGRGRSDGRMGFAPEATPPRGWLLPLGLSVVVTGGYLGARLLLLGSLTGYLDDPHSWWVASDGTASRLMAVPLILAFYLRRVLYPWWLGFESGITPVRDATDAGLWASLVGLAVLVFLVHRFRHRDPALPFGVAWFLLTLLPVANILPLFESAMEHFAYLPSVGLVVASVAFGRALLKGRAARITACCFVAGLLGARTVARNPDWKSEETFWRVTTRDTPSARAFNNLGLHLHEAGRLEEAAETLARVRALEPNLPSSHSNLGVALAAQGRRAEALSLFEQALQMNPLHAESLFNLAMLLETNEAGERYGPGFHAQRAIEAYGDLLEAHPDHAEGWTNLGVLHERLNQPHEAARAFERAIEADPALPQPHAFLASMLWSRNERERAVTLYRRYLEIAPEGEHAAEARSRMRP